MTPEQLDEVEKLAERDEARALVRLWEETAQQVVAMFDPLNPKVSPGVLSAVAQGAKTANKSLRDDRAALKVEVEQLREAARQVHALAEVLLPVWPESRFGGPIREIHKITKGMVE